MRDYCRIGLESTPPKKLAVIAIARSFAASILGSLYEASDARYAKGALRAQTRYSRA
jgi:hypothetical protein